MVNVRKATPLVAIYMEDLKAALAQVKQVDSQIFNKSDFTVTDFSVIIKFV